MTQGMLVISEIDIKKFLSYVDKEALCPSKMRLPENEILCEEGTNENCQLCWKQAIEAIKDE